MSGKEEAYASSNLGGRVGFGKRPAIVVIDLQKGFTLAEATAGADMTETVESVNRLTEAAREKNIKVYYTHVGYQKDGIDLGVFGHKAFVLKEFTRDHWNYELDDRLKIKEYDVIIEKHWPSSFFGTHLLQMLITTHVDTLIITGCTTAGCVYATTLDSCSYGFRTMVVSDGIADRAEETHNMFLWNMGQKYADVLTVEETIEEIKKIDKLDYDLLF
ncbi:MAG: isochorismatase family protein [Bacteroidia bacterium]|nr:isochorismatase family protein [Bacteroidia bacterium]